MTARFNLFIALILIVGSLQLNGQQAAAIDSLKKGLIEAKSPEEKIFWMDNLSRVMMNVSPQAADSVGREMILLADESRNRQLMIRAYMSNGLRFSYFGGQKNYINKSIEHYEKALQIARQNKMEKWAAKAMLQLASVYLSVPDKEKSLKYVTEAFARIGATDDDSLKVESNNVYGQVYLARNEKILALRHYLTALSLAEQIKPKNQDEKKLRSELMRNSYLHLSGFYSKIDDVDKAIDYYKLAYEKLEGLPDKRIPYQRAIDLTAIGNLYSKNKNYDIAIKYFERTIAMADSLKFSNLKMPAYISLMNQHLRKDEPQKALDYLRSSQGKTLEQFFSRFGLTAVLYQAYGIAFNDLNKPDSAIAYLLKALPYFESNLNETNKIALWIELGKAYAGSGDTRKAIDYLLKAKEAGEKLDDLDVVMVASKKLDTLYQQSGEFKLATIYNGIYHTYKDSIEKLTKEKEVAQVEAADEQQRQVRIEKEREETRRRKNNIQYLAIIMGIVLLFITLVVLGMFKVSATVIKAVGFFVFLLFFEFIFLVFKKNIYSITQGEPWKDLAFMIALAALLVPLHHWMEHRVLHYLTSHNRLTAAGQNLRKRLVRKRGQVNE